MLTYVLYEHQFILTPALAGSGKTYLTSRVIDEISATLHKDKNHEAFAFFYCNRNEQERQKALSVLRSYIRQLSAPTNASDSIYPQLEQLHTNSQLKASGWTLELCKEYLVKLFNFYPRTTLILDTLDECLVEDREFLLDFFDTLAKASLKTVRIFISSRPKGDIRQRLIHLSNIEILATDNEDDIAKFVQQSMERNSRWSSSLNRNQALKDEIAKTLLHKSNGMFQWANLQIKQLLNLRSEPELRDRLGKLPDDLNSAYDDIYNNIKKLPECSRAQALRALRWVMCAYQPLTSQALLAAVRIDPGKEGVCESFEPMEDELLDWCANLLTVDSQQNPPVWRVSHLSVVEYLESHCTLVRAHCFVASASLTLLLATYMDKQDRGRKPGDIFHLDHKLQVYVRHHWIRHVQTQEGEDADPMLVDRLKTFLGSPGESSVQYRQWYLQVKADKYKPSTSALSRISIEEISPESSTILAICRFSFYTLLSSWWRKEKTPPPQTNGQGDNLLMLATVAGCRPICEALIEWGIYINLQGGQYGSALVAAAAAQSWNTETAKFLVEQGADVNMQVQAGCYGSALAAAAHWGRKGCAESLIDAGAKVSLRLENGLYTTALRASEANVCQADQGHAWWDERDEKRLKREQAEVAEFFRRTVQ